MKKALMPVGVFAVTQAPEMACQVKESQTTQ